MAILNAFSGVATIFLLGLLGFYLARSGKVPPQTVAALPRFTTTIALPPFLLRTATETINRDQLTSLLIETRIPYISIFLTFFLAVFLTKLLRTAPARKAMFQVGIATSNAMTIGLPINLAIFGPAGLPYALLYFVANATFFWTIGCSSIARSGNAANEPMFSRESLKRIFSPPIIGFILGLLMVYFDLRLPDFLDKTFKYVGDMVVGLVTMYIGMTVSTIRREDISIDKDVIVVVIGRMFLSPLLILFLTWLMPIDPLMRNVFIIQSSLPVMINAAILCAYYQTDTRYAAVLISITTLLSLVTIPLYMVLITFFLS